MDLEDIMAQENFVVVGDTLNRSKYAAKIKDKLIDKGYNVYAVGKELSSINDVPGDIDILDLCINPEDGLKLIKENKKPVKCVVIQPGAESWEIFQYLKESNIDYVENCLLVGMRMFPRSRD